MTDRTDMISEDGTLSFFAGRGSGHANATPRPAHIQRALDLANRRDRRYFARHPGVTEYERRTVVGEFWPHPQEHRVRRVRVVQLAPGERMRYPLLADGGRL